MDLDRHLLVNFAKAVNNKNESSVSDKYIRGTAKVIDGKKYVQLDGSNVTTPISETVDVQNGDRVLVSIENHSATILGNFTFPPSARKEQEAIDKAEDAQTNSSIASEKAQEAGKKADQAIADSSVASSQANEAKKNAQDAINAANSASTNATEAKSLATQAGLDATTAKESAAKAQADVANANAEIGKLQGEVTTAKGNIDTALKDLNTQAGEIAGIKENYSTKIEVNGVKAELSTEIDKKVGQLQTTISETYSTKTENTELEGRLQSQITQNKDGIASQVSKTEKLEADTAQAQADVTKALANAATAQAAADTAKTNAAAAQTAADAAKADALTASNKATAAQNAADAANAAASAADQKVQAAQGDLDEAKKNLANVTGRVDATEQEVADAQAKVDAAQQAVNGALADAVEANLAASKAQEAANKAQTDATTAQQTANNAQNKADAAQSLADKAQADAAQAQKDVAALTERVTSAETSIKQNSENITLNANKTEEIGNNLKNNYYSKTETDAQIKVESDKISSTVSSKITTEIGKVQVGGRNLARETSSEWSEWVTPKANWENWCRMICDIYLSNDKKVGDEYTAQIEIEFADVNKGTGTMPFMMQAQGNGIKPDGSIDWSKNTGVWNARLLNLKEPPKNGIYKYVAVIPIYNEYQLEYTKFSCNIRTDNWDGIGKYRYRCVKHEKGNKPTDWTPAPEDMATDEDAKNVLETAQNAQNKADNVDSRLTISESTIKQLSDSISSLVTDENGNSMMTQTSNGWTFNISNIEKNINDATNQLNDLSGTIKEADSTINNLNNLVNDISKKTAYIVMTTDEQGNPCIELGKEGNDFKVRITNTSVDFMEGTSKITYISNETLYIERAIVKDELQIGETTGFIWKRRGNGNMGLRWVGGV